jgi:hypothetical protein
MPDIYDMVQIVVNYDCGKLSWQEAYLKLTQIGTPDHIIMEAIGNEPEEI